MEEPDPITKATYDRGYEDGVRDTKDNQEVVGYMDKRGVLFQMRALPDNAQDQISFLSVHKVVYVDRQEKG